MVADRSLQALFRVGAVGAMEDEQLLHIFATRVDEAAAEAAFGALVDRHGPVVLRVCRGVLNDEHAAEDAFQATFLVLARRASSVRKADSIASWLFGVARRVAAKSRADAARRRAGDRRVAELASRRAAEAGNGVEAWPEVYEELARLPERYRTPLVLCHLSGLTYQEAADRLNCPVRTVQTRLIRGRERLRGLLTRRGLAPLGGLIGVALATEPARAAVPAALVEATARSALRFAAGATVGTVPLSAEALAEGMLKTMLFKKLKVAAAAVTACLVAAGGGFLMNGIVQAQAAPKPGPAAAAKPESRADRDALQGRWSVEVPGPDGRKQALSWEIKGDSISLRAVAPGGEIQEVLKGRIELNPAARPRTFSIVGAAGPDGRPEKDNLGIYEVDGGRLKICMGTPGQPRPKEFKPGKSGPPMLLTFKRGGPEPAREATPRAIAPAPADPVEISGRVLDPEGRPFASAEIHFVPPDDARPGEDPRPVAPAEREARATSGADGRFRFLASAADFAGAEAASPAEQPTLSATARGFGPGWVACPAPSSASGITLKLARDDVPIEGRVLDLEGRPVAEASVRILGLEATRGDDPGPILRAFKASPAPVEIYSHLVRRLDRSASGLPESVRTGPDGRFLLGGVGRGRVAMLRIEGPAIATQKSVAVLANPSPLAADSATVKKPDAEATFSANPVFEIHAGPTQPIVGVVRDKDSGLPLGGVIVKSWVVAQARFLANDYVRTTTDEQGRYRLVGLPKGPGHTIIAIPPEDQPYLASSLQVGSAPGVEPVTADISLKRGVLIRGRVTGPDGHPVRARVEYFAEHSNPAVNEAPGFSGTIRAVGTRPDGTFAIAALPGGGLLAVRADGRFPTADKLDGFKQAGGLPDWWPHDPHLLQLLDCHAIVRVSPEDGAEELRRDIDLGAKTGADRGVKRGAKP